MDFASSGRETWFFDRVRAFIDVEIPARGGRDGWGFPIVR